MEPVKCGCNLFQCTGICYHTGLKPVDEITRHEYDRTRPKTPLKELIDAGVKKAFDNWEAGLSYRETLTTAELQEYKRAFPTQPLS